MSTVYENVMNNVVGNMPMVELAPETAKELFEKYQAEWQRPINKSRLNKIKADMEAGKFGPYSVIKLGQVGDTIKALDGQHRFLAQALTGSKQKYCVQTIPFTSWEEARREYALHIDTGQPRRLSDALRALGLWKDRLQPGLLTTLGQSVSYIDKVLLQRTKNRIDGEELAIEIQAREYDKKFMKVLAILQDVHGNDDLHKLMKLPITKSFFRAPVIGIILLLLEQVPHDTTKFLKEIFSESSPINTPTNSLRNFLLSTRISGGATGLREAHGVSKYLISRGVAHAWNAFLNDKLLPAYSVSDIKRGHIHPQGLKGLDGNKLMI